MIPRLINWAVLFATAALAAAQKPAPQPDDAAALEEAIRAVDRAAEKTNGPKTPASAPPADTRATNPARPEPAAKPVTPAPGGATAPGKPEPSQPAAESPSGSKPAKPKNVAATLTQITGLEDAELDNVRSVIVFRRNVVVDRPDLKIWCDRLEIALNRDGRTKPADAGSGQSDQQPDAFGAESIKSATATAAAGGLVVIWRKTETGDVVAVGKKAVYTAADGTFTITGLPEVLRDMSVHFYSTGESDRLVMFKNGSARGGKKQDINLSEVRAREIRQRMFSNVPGRRPAEASAAGAEEAPAAAGNSPPPAALPAPPPVSDSGH